MSHATDIVGYIYKADTYCPGCVVRVVAKPAGSRFSGPAEESLDILAAAVGVDRFDEHSFDSDNFPKVVFRSQVEDEERCGACGEEL